MLSSRKACRLEGGFDESTVSRKYFSYFICIRVLMIVSIFRSMFFACFKSFMLRIYSNMSRLVE